jgi:hypothetical protein
VLAVIAEVCLRTIPAACFFVVPAHFDGATSPAVFARFCSPPVVAAAVRAFFTTYPEFYLRGIVCGVTTNLPPKLDEA